MLAVEGVKGLAGLGGADENGVALQLIGVEGVHRLGQLGHDEIGHVHDVADGVQADGGEAALQPLGGRRDGDVFENLCAVPRAEVEIFNLDVDGGRGGGEQVETDGIFQAAAGDGGDFTGHAVMAPKVGAMGDGLVVDLDDAVGQAAGDGRAHLRDELELQMPV